VLIGTRTRRVGGVLWESIAALCCMLNMIDMLLCHWCVVRIFVCHVVHMLVYHGVRRVEMQRMWRRGRRGGCRLQSRCCRGMARASLAFNAPVAGWALPIHERRAVSVLKKKKNVWCRSRVPLISRAAIVRAFRCWGGRCLQKRGVCSEGIAEGCLV